MQVQNYIIIKTIVNMNSKTQFSPISHLMDNGTQINDLVKMANIFNYFVNVGTQTDKTIPRTKKSPTDYLKNRAQESIFLAPVTPKQIEINIHSFKSKRPLVLMAFLFFIKNPQQTYFSAITCYCQPIF